jgi:hypothetical protein
MKGAVGSLNAAVAGSILLFEALAQRDPNAMPSLPSQDAAANEGPVTDPANAAATSIAAGSELAAEPQRKGRKGLSTQPLEPDETTASAPPTRSVSTKPATPKSAPKPRVQKSSSTEFATAATPSPATKPAIRKPTTAKATHSKTAAAKTAAAKTATSKAAAAQVPSADPEPATPPKPRKGKRPTSGRATPSEPDPGTADDDLLPTDGATSDRTPHA